MLAKPGASYSVYRIRSEARKGSLTTPKKKRIGVILKSSRKVKYNDFVQSGVHIGKLGNKALLIERGDIIAWCHDYLHNMKRFRTQRRNIIYLDETWINVGHTVLKEWKDKFITIPKDAIMCILEDFGLP